MTQQIPKKIAIQIVQHKDIEYIKNCLDSIYQSNTDGLLVDIYVLDNNTDDGSYEFVKNNYPSVFLIRSTKKNCFVWNQNYLFQLTKDKYDYIWVLNNDTIINEFSIIQLIQAFKYDLSLGIVGPQLYYCSGEKQNSGGNLTFFSRFYTIFRIRDLISIKNRNRIKVLINFFKGGSKKNVSNNIVYKQCISGAAMMIRSEVIKEIGIFDINLSMYGEDSEYCIRALKNGFRNAIVKDAKVTHIHSPKYDNDTQYKIIFGMFYLMHKYHYPQIYYWFIAVLLYIKYIPSFFIKKDTSIYKILKIPRIVKDI